MRARLFALALLIASPALAAGDHWTRLADGIVADIARVEQLALAGQADEAKKALTQAYFGQFESGKMEAALRKEVGSKHAFEREKLFGDLRKAINKGAPDEVKALAGALKSGLKADGQALDKAGVSPDVFQVNQ